MDVRKRVGFLTRAGCYSMLEGTPAHLGRRAVRIGLAVLILLNVAAVILESVRDIGRPHAALFWWFEVASVAVFTLEYLLRLWCCVEDERYAGRWGRFRYALRPMALIDLVAIAPFYLTAFTTLDTRVLRALRLLRIFKLSRQSTALDLLLTVVRREAPSIASAMFIMVIVIILAATGIYLIERDVQANFDSIPKAIWWAAVTLSTVGYGDVVPVTTLGKVFGLLITFAGVGMVALPAGILASGYSLELQSRREAFRLQVKRAMEGEQSSKHQARELDETRGELGLTKEEAQQVIESEQAEQTERGPPACPHCGKPLAAAPPRP